MQEKFIILNDILAVSVFDDARIVLYYRPRNRKSPIIHFLPPVIDNTLKIDLPKSVKKFFDPDIFPELFNKLRVQL